MKDPAFLFYSQDFLTGTIIMPFEDRGKYITLLCYQHQNGRMDEETICLLVGSVSVMLKSKFSIDENGKWYNERLETEIEKRNKYTESRRNNGIKGGRPKNGEKPYAKPYGKPTNNHTENENENIILNNSKANFEIFRQAYPGRKGGFEVEFKNFIKKNNPEVADLLLPALLAEIDHRKRAKTAGLFVQEWKHLPTWINKKCWLDDLPEIKPKPKQFEVTVHSKPLLP